MTQWVMHLLRQCEDWSSDPQNSRKPGWVCSLPIISVCRSGDRASPSPGWMGELQTQWETLPLKIKVEGNCGRQLMSTFTSHTHLHICACNTRKHACIYYTTHTYKHTHTSTIFSLCLMHERFINIVKQELEWACMSNHIIHALTSQVRTQSLEEGVLTLSSANWQVPGFRGRLEVSPSLHIALTVAILLPHSGPVRSAGALLPCASFQGLHGVTFIRITSLWLLV